MRDAYGLMKLMLGRSNPFRSTSSQSTYHEHETYLPPHIKAAMQEHMQQTVPAHLKKYEGGTTYVPQHAEAELAQHLESSLPDHLKPYAGAYVQQQIVQPGMQQQMAGRSPVPQNPESGPAPGVMPVGQVVSPVVVGSAGPSPAPPGPAPLPSADVPEPNAGGNPDQAYSFITDPAKPPRGPLLTNIPGGNSLIGRIGLVCGSLLILFILFSVVRGLFNSTPDLSSVFTVVQEQQEILHLTNGVRPGLLSPATADANANVKLSVGTSESQLTHYMVKNHYKIQTKFINAKVSHSADTQLANSIAGGTYDQTYRSILQGKLKTYANSLQAAYKQVKGPKGRTLLKNAYQQVQLLQIQLNSPNG